MGKLGVLYYEVKLKDSITGLSSIEQKIKKLSTEIKPKIVANDLKDQFKTAASGIGAVQVKVTAYKQVFKDSLKEALNKYTINATVGIKAVDLRNSITNAIAKTDFKAHVSAYAVELRKSIKDAIAIESYKAKIVADTTTLTSAIQKQVSQQTYTAKVTLTATSSTQDKQKKTKEVTDTKTKKKQDEPIKVKVDASSAPKDIQTAIDKGTYTAKVGADTTQLVDAINKAIPKEKKIQITGSVGNGNTSSGTTSGGGKSSNGSKSDNDAKAAQRAVERQQKAYYNHLNQMQDMRLAYEKDKRTAIRKMGMSEPKTNSATVALGNVNGTRYIEQLLPRMAGVKETIYKYQQEINKLDKVNGALVDKLNSGKLNPLKSFIANRQLQENVGWVQAYKNEIQALKREYANLSKNLNISQRMSLPQTFVGYGGTPANHREMQGRWKEHFAWKDRVAGFTKSGRMLSADELSKVEELKNRFSALYKRIESRRNTVQGLLGLASSKNDSNAIRTYTEQLGKLESLLGRIRRMSQQTTLSLPRMQGVGGYGSVPANHAEMQKKWESHFAWKDELAAQEKSKRAEEARLVAIKAAAEQRKQAAVSARQYATEMQRVASEMNNVGSRSGWLRDQLQNIFSMYGVQQFLQNLIMIGGEFEKQKIALGSIFKNTAKGNETFEQIKQWSVKSPFTFSNLTAYTKQLASFGFQYRDVFETTKKLADISAGVGVDMGRIILAYGQVYTAHYLRGQELRQFTEAGIPMVDELSKVLTERMGKKVSAGDVFKLISDKQVEFEDVKKVIDKITGDGGTFYKMQEKQSESLVGKWTNLKDAIEIMYSDVEFANNGILKGAITMLTKLALYWKGVGISVLAVASAYGLLALKNRLVYATASREASLIATMDAKKAAIDSQTMSYNRLAEAIAKKNYVEGKYYANSLGVFGKNGRQRSAAMRMSERLVYNGTPASQITPIYAAGSVTATPNADGTFTYKGTIDKEFQERIKAAEKFRRELAYLKLKSTGSIFDGKTWALWGAQSQLALKNVWLSLKAFGASMLATMSSMLPMMAITAAFGGIMYWRQNKAERENRTKEMIDGAKSSYKEVSDFLRDNPIEIHIQKMDKEDISGIIDTYKEQARNSPINIDFAIANANNMSDYAEQLKYLRTQLEYVAMAEKYAADNGKGIADSIKDETGGWFNDDYAENVKDYAEAVDEYHKALAKLEDKDINGFISKLDSQTNFDPQRKAALALAEDLKKLRSEGASTNKVLATIFSSEYYTETALGNIWGSGNIKDGVNAYKDYISSQTTLDADSQDAVDKIRQKLEAIPNALDANGRLTDLGHTMIVRLAQSIGEDAGLVKEQIDLIVGDFEGKFQPSMQASWQDSSQAMNALMDQMRANCADLFQGMDLSNGFTEEQRKAIQACIDKAPAECKKYTAIWQRLLDQHQLYIRVGSDFNATGLPGQTQSSLQSIWNTRYKNNKDYAKYAPSKDDTMVSWGDARKKNIEDNKKELARLLKAKRTPQSKVEIYQRQEDIKKETKVWKDNDPYGYSQYEEEQRKKNKKGGKNTNKNNTKNDPNKEQREREARLQKRFQQIKRVREMYEKLRGLYGDEVAIKKIRESHLVSEDLIPTDVHSMEDFLKKYRTIMKKFYNSYKANTENLKNLNSTVAQELLNIQFDKEKEQLDKAVSTLETQLERAGDAWTRYKSLVGDGVGKPIANLLAFGFDFGSDSYQTDDTGSQRLESLREQAARHITEKAVGKSTSEYDMDRYLSMNEDELKTEFGGNEKVTKGLWSIVKAYQEAAKTIRSENDKLIAELYKQSLSYAEQINSITQKHKGERATIKEKRRAYEPAKKNLNDALSGQEKAYKNYNDAIALAHNTNEYKFYQKTAQTREEAQQNLDNYRDLSPDKKLNLKKENNITEESLKKVLAEAIQEEKNNKKAYESTAEYTVVQEAEENKKINDRKVDNARNKLKDTLPPEVADALIAQSKINERNEKSEVSIKELEGSEPYIELFNNIYNLASRTAKDLANDLIDTLDEKLAKGEISTEDYVKVRNEISSKRNEVYEKGTDSKNAKLWQVGFGGILKNKVQQSESERNTAGEEMKSLQTKIDQNESTMTTEQKAVQMADLQQKYEQAKTNLNNATTEGDRESYKEEMQNVRGRIDKLNDTETITEDEKSTRRTILGGLYDNAKQRYEEADAQGNELAKKQAKQDMIQGGFGMAANMGQNLTQFRDTLGGTLDAFGVDTENNEGFQKFSTAVDVMSDVSSGMSNAMQSMMSGDFVGAAFSIIETPMNIANAFAKLHDKKLDIQINQSKQLMEEVQTASEDLKNAIQSSLGSEDAKNRALSRQGEMAQILSDAGVKDTEGAGFVYNMVSGKTSGSDLISQNRNKYYGKDGKVTDQAYRKKFSFGKFLLNTVALTGSQPITAPTTMAAGVTADASTGGMSGLTATTAAATKVASDSVTGLVKAVKGSFTLVKNEEAKAYTRMADSLEKAGFGNHSQVSVYGAEYASLLEQRKQAEYQMKMEQDKSNTDDDKIKEYKSKIKELNQQIHEYMTNLAKELYGIDFTSWANKLGDALTNAFRNGEDAAAAFHDAVGDIMADLVKNMIITDAIKPMFTKLEETLFGKDDDMSGMLDVNDMEGSIKKAVPYISSFFNDVENSVPGWQKLYDVLDEASGGIVKKTSSSSSSMSGSIKGITEETSTLLASYINAIRLDVSVNRKTFKDLAEVTIPKMSVIAENQLRQLNVIAEQTTKIEENTRKNYEAVDLIRSYISSVSTTTSGGKAIRVK